MKNKLLLKISLYDETHEYATDTYDVEKIKDVSKIDLQELIDDVKEARKDILEEELKVEANRLVANDKAQS